MEGSDRPVDDRVVGGSAMLKASKIFPVKSMSVREGNQRRDRLTHRWSQFVRFR